MKKIKNLDTLLTALNVDKRISEHLYHHGIAKLSDFDTFDLKDLKNILGEDFGAIVPILAEYHLPHELRNLGFSSELVGILTDHCSVNSLDELVDFGYGKLIAILNDPFLQKEIDELYDLYGYSKQLDSTEILSNVTGTDERLKKEVEAARKSYGSRQYSHFKIRIASPDEIRMWSYGEVKNAETINYRTAKHEKEGLFCERIFGPVRDFQCDCGKKQQGQKGQICAKCGIEITDSKVRRERMGHIELQAPVVHTWYLKNSPSRIALLLGLKSKELEAVVAHASYIVTKVNPGSGVPIQKNQILTERERTDLEDDYGNRFEALTGGEAIKRLLQNLNLEELAKSLRKRLNRTTKQVRTKTIKRLEVVEAFLHSDNKPEWMVLDVIPVLPPDLRPMVALDGGRFATTDLNDLYRTIINRNVRLKKLKAQIGVPRLVIKNENRMLQVAVDALLDNSKIGKKAGSSQKRQLKSLSDLLKGKPGRFRQNLLGKRVDYSGRSVIIVGPDLKMFQCGIPREMAVILFKPFILKELQSKVAHKPGERSKKGPLNKKYEERGEDVWNALEKVVKEHPVLLNRAPTLHRLGIQAFEPKLIDGKAIRLHPLVTTAFNADFDGDQMAVHVPLSPEAQAEARLLMLASNNILNPKDGKPVASPSQDMVLGNYYLTIEERYHPNSIESILSPDAKVEEKHRNEGKFFSSIIEAKIAHANNEIDLHTRIFIKPTSINSYFAEEQKDKYLATTLGKLIFNEILPAWFPYINIPSRQNLDDKTPDFFFMKKGSNPHEFLAQLPLTKPFDKVFLENIIGKVFESDHITETSKMLDKLKDIGFRYATVAGFSISFDDINPYSGKDETLERTEKEIDEIDQWIEWGLFSEVERKREVVDKWQATRENILYKLVGELDPMDIRTQRMSLFADSDHSGVVVDNQSTKPADVISTWVKAIIADERLGIYEDEAAKFAKLFEQDKAAIANLLLEYRPCESAASDLAITYILGKICEQVDEQKLTSKAGFDKFVSVFKDYIKFLKSLQNEYKGYRRELRFSDLPGNNMFMMAASGARGNVSNFSQLMGIRGIMRNPKGEPIEVPVKSSFREGLSVSEFFISTHGARKGSTDTALKTADSGYLTRRLVDVSQDVIVVEDDCGSTQGFVVKDIIDDNKVIVELGERIVGRFAASDVIHPKTGKVIIETNHLITRDIAKEIVAAGIDEVNIRSLLTCNSLHGVCAKCYGVNLATNNEVEVGEAVGVVAAQSIGEPGTQLTMRTFHTGGVAGKAEITQGLARIEELFELRQPKGKSIIAEVSGTVAERISRGPYTMLTINDENNEPHKYALDRNVEAIVRKGDKVVSGQRLSPGSIFPKELLRVKSITAAYNYILEEVQKVYEAQGVSISDKHIEIILRQMTRRILVIKEGDTDLLPGVEISVSDFTKAATNALQNRANLPVGRPVLLGIARAALRSDSFLSAASFQETTKILTDAAIRGKTDELHGLKENVIIGGLIPAGTGILKEKSFYYDHEDLHPDDEYFDTNPADVIASDHAQTIAESQEIPSVAHTEYHSEE